MEGIYSKPLPQIDEVNRPFWEANSPQRTTSSALQRLPPRVVSGGNKLLRMPLDQFRMERDERPWNRMVIHRLSSLLASGIRKGHSL